MNLQEQILSMKQYINDAEEQLAQLQAGRKSSSAKIRSNLMKEKQQVIHSDVMSLHFRRHFQPKNELKSYQ